MKTLKDIADGFRTSKTKTIVSFLAISIGMTALAVLFSLMQGLNFRSTQIIESLGINSFAVRSDSEEKDFLTERHARLLSSNLPSCKVAAIRSVKLNTKNDNITLDASGVDGNYFEIHRRSVVDGRCIDEYDDLTVNNSIIIDPPTANRLKAGIGDCVFLGNVLFKIVGIIDTNTADNSSSGSILLKSPVIMPLSISERFLPKNLLKSKKISFILVSAKDSREFDTALRRTENLLNQPDQHVENISFITPDSLLAGTKKLKSTIALAAGSVAFLCILLGGITLATLMAANVRERTAEIGLRMALGALPRDIASLFIIESCLITGTASVIGVLIAFAIMSLSAQFISIPAVFNAATVLAPVIIALLLGIIFSYFPARTASRISPSEALRND